MKHTYPAHIYDPRRRQIAAELMQHELRLLLQSVPEPLWARLDRDVTGWFDGDSYNLAPVHDFWNAADGVMRGFKLKGLIRYITAENVAWEQAEIPVADIDITWKMPILAQFGDPPYDTRELGRQLSVDPELKRELLANSDLHAAISVPRDHFPVVLLAEGNRWRIGDGNRRVLRALLYGRPGITAWTAMLPRHQPLRNYWVSTGFLRELGEQALIAQSAGDNPTLQGIRSLVRSLFEQSTIARINFDLRVKDKYSLLAD